MANPQIQAISGGVDLALRQGQTAGPFRQFWVTRQSTAETGPWNVATAYAAGDVVTYNGVEWMASRDNTGVTPTEGADWELNEIPLDITGYVIRVSISAADAIGNPTGKVLLSFDSENPSDGGSSITIVTGNPATTDLKISDEDTAALPVWQLRETETSTSDKRGIWDEELESPAGDVPITLQGRVSVDPQVSKNE